MLIKVARTRATRRTSTITELLRGPVAFGLLLAGVLLAPGVLAAEPDAEAPATLAGMIERVAAENPQVAAARAEWRAAIEVVRQAGAPPDPVLMVDWFGESVETRVGPQEYRIGVSQALPWPGTLAQATDVAALEARVRQSLYELTLLDVVTELRVSYHELTYLRGALELTRRHEALLKQVEQVVTARYADGRATLNDQLKARGQLAQLSYDAVLLREMIGVEQAKLNAMLDHPVQRPIGELAPAPLRVVSVPLEQLVEAAVENRQSIDVAAGQVAKSAAGIRLAELRNRPGFTLSASRIGTGEAQRPMADSGKDPWMVGLGVRIPLWLGSNRGRVAEAEARHEAAMHRHRGAENSTRSEVASVWFRLENARRLIELYDASLLPQAREAMAAAEAWSEEAPGNTSGYLETQGVWLNFHLARLRAATDYQQQRARLERLLGMPVTLLEAPAPEAP